MTVRPAEQADVDALVTIWHDGWHVGLIFLGLRLNGQEPPEEWEEPNVWGQWRTEVWE